MKRRGRFPFTLSLSRWSLIWLLPLVSLSPIAGAARHTAAPEVSLRRGFASPPAQAKLRCYWWWLNGNTTEATITRDLAQMAAKGFGGVLLVDANGSNQNGNENVPAGPLFGSPAWVKLYRHALQVAAQLHLEISLNITSGWNLGGPDVTPEQAAKILTWSRLDVAGGEHIDEKLPQPAMANGFYREIAVLAYPLRHSAALPGAEGGMDRHPIRALRFKTASMETGFSMPDSTPLLEDYPAVAGEEDTELAGVRDLSSKMRSGGVLDWQVPPGKQWEILRIGYTDSNARVSTSSGAWQGLAIDYLDHDAFDAYWNHTVVPLLDASEPYLGTTLKYLVTDSWELGGTNWTARFREEFKARRGYDPVPYLPVVAGRIVGSRDASNRFLADLRRTVGDLVVAEHYDVFARHARRYGLGVHPESGGPHGAPIDALETFRSSAFPQTEFWAMSREHRTRDDERFFTKEASSAAHIYGKPLVAEEGMTSIGPQWSESLANDLKPTFDQALTEGMNRLFWHEFTSSPVSFGLPGEEYFAGTHLNPNVTWWVQSDAFFAYLNRSQFMMQQGTPVSDLLYYYGDEVPNFVRLKRDDPAHVLPGYDYDVTDEDALLHTIGVHDGRLRAPGGMEYRALAMPATRQMTLAALQRIALYVRGGGTVIGPRPLSASGNAGAQTRQEFQRIAGAMWGACDARSTRRRYGRGWIYCSGSAHDAFETMHLPEDFSAQGEQAASALDFVHRRDGATDIYFVRNGTAHPVDTVAAFRVAGKEPQLWDAVTGSIAPLWIYQNAGESAAAGTTHLPLHLDAYGSIFVVFRPGASLHIARLERDGAVVFPSSSPSSLPAISQHAGSFEIAASQAGTYNAVLSDGRTLTATLRQADAWINLSRSWEVSFQPGRGAPSSVQMKKLESWTNSANPGIRYFSGTAIYHATFSIATAALPAELWLQLSELHEICTVKINGREAGAIWAMPLRLRIDPYVKPGENTIDIAVTNLWPNRIIGDLQPSAMQKYTSTNIRKYTKDSPLLLSGLIGPVRILARYNAPLRP